MKRGKRFFVLIALLVTLCIGCLLSGCTSLADVAPKSYGNWDGNYIYLGNARCKTTGEEEERLVKTLEKEGVLYQAKQTWDYLFVGEDLYLCLEMENVVLEETTTCFVRYDVAEDDAEVIYWETEGLNVREIYKISETFVILRAISNTGDRNLFKIDYNGNMLSNNENDLESRIQTGDYLVWFDYNTDTLFYRAWEQDDFSKLCDFQNLGVQSINAQYVEAGERKGFLLQTMRNDLWCGLYFYDFVDLHLHEFLLLNKTEELLVKGEFVMVGKPMEVPYTITYTIHESKAGTNFFTKRTETQTLNHFMYQNCRLYQIDYESLTLQQTFDFSEKYAEKDFTDFTVFDDGRIYFDANEVVYGGGCRQKNDSVEHTSYVLEENTGKLKQVSSKVYSAWYAEQNEKELREKGAHCGDYSYYMEYDYYGAGRKQIVVTLWRYHTQTKETNAMQFWEEQSAQGGCYEVQDDGETIVFRYSLLLKQEWAQTQMYYGGVNGDKILVLDK